MFFYVFLSGFFTLSFSIRIIIRNFGDFSFNEAFSKLVNFRGLNLILRILASITLAKFS